MKKGEKFRRGFTIIEVSLVISIAGLIFLMVFIALPGLRASQRDEERRTDVLKVISEIKNYQSNNRGALPSLPELTVVGIVEYGKPDKDSNGEWEDFYSDYLGGGSFTDPNGEHYKLEIHDKCRSATHTLNVTVGAACEDYGLSELPNAIFPNDYTMIIVPQATCEGEQAVKSSNPRKAAVLYRLESAGVYCANT